MVSGKGGQFIGSVYKRWDQMVVDLNDGRGGLGDENHEVKGLV
jgi:hypothetical protein